MVYHPFRGTLLVGEMIITLCFVFAMCWLIILFFSKKKQFPTTYIAIVMIYPVWLVVDQALITIVLPNHTIFNAAMIKQLSVVVISAGIWSSYLLRSKRVKATFIYPRTLERAKPIAPEVDTVNEIAIITAVDTRGSGSIKRIFISIAVIIVILLGGFYWYDPLFVKEWLSSVSSSLPPCRGTQPYRFHNCHSSILFSDGSKYVGEWKDGRYHGRGTKTYPSGAKYVGEWKKDSKWEGTQYDEDGDVFGTYSEGVWKIVN